VRASPQTSAVLDALSKNAGSWHYGYDLSKVTGLKSGTLYPILQRLNDAGWLETKWEEATEPGRPPRHLYRMTRTGRIAAQQFAGKQSKRSTARVAYES